MSTEITLKKSTSLIAPENFEHYFRIANMMSKSDMVPKAYKDKPQDVLIAMEMGVSLGIGPLQAVQNIAVINGKPCLYGDGVLAVCSGHPEFEDMIEEPIIGDGGRIIGFKCTVKRKGRTPATQIFTEVEAKKANLLGKPGPWSNYPTRMLQMRARGFVLRDTFSDALGGVRVAEEVQDYEEKDITPRNRVDISDIISNKQKPKVEMLSVDKSTGEILNNELTEQEQADILAKELAGE